MYSCTCLCFHMWILLAKSTCKGLTNPAHDKCTGELSSHVSDIYQKEYQTWSANIQSGMMLQYEVVHG